jgi:hypothetical protein
VNERIVIDGVPYVKEPQRDVFEGAWVLVEGEWYQDIGHADPRSDDLSDPTLVCTSFRFSDNLGGADLVVWNHYIKRSRVQGYCLTLPMRFLQLKREVLEALEKINQIQDKSSDDQDMQWCLRRRAETLDTWIKEATE